MFERKNRTNINMSIWWKPATWQNSRFYPCSLM